MAEILLLNRWRSERATRRSRVRLGETGGQVLFFTGVRYERLDPRTPADGVSANTLEAHLPERRLPGRQTLRPEG